jgi:hypothetical protein
MGRTTDSRPDPTGTVLMIESIDLNELDDRMTNLEDKTPTELYTVALAMRETIWLYREQINYLTSELHRIGWTPYNETT